MAQKNLLLLSVVTLCLIACTTAERNELNNIKPGQDLAARLHSNAGRVMECWNALVKLKHFSNVIVKFFLTGQTSNITPECCRAVVILVHQCWPTDLTSLGFTHEEANILRWLLWCNFFSRCFSPC
ncbi:Egg cell-secreted protein 1.1 [Melia azedarach]|uniref:Egg cell-secreted protein 1.1 n=1 Tax=Melia azedarach TaxID=155640 RepID=A0ACC1XWH2_MELAZ|nr:Egg cell-secreted protein 1.1 [Melia azedarach]